MKNIDKRSREIIMVEKGFLVLRYENDKDIIKKAMIDINTFLDKELPQTKMIMQVHDELIFETPKANAEEILNLMKDMMEKAVKLDIPLIADAAIGQNWNEAH